MNRHLASGWHGRGAVSTPAVAAVDDQALRARVQHALIHQAAGVLRLDPSRMDPGAELGEFGFDSVMLAELAVAFNDTFGIDVNPTVFFEYPTMEALSAHLATLHRAVFERHFGTSSVAGSGDDATASEPGDFPVPQDDDTPRRRPSWREMAHMASQPPAGPARFAGAAAAMPAQAPASEPVAIIGVSGHFPQARSVEELWSRLEAGDDCVTQMPAWRWPVVDGVRIRHAGVIDGIDEFDASFFGISPKEAEAMDPSQRLLLMHAWKAIEDAGYAPHGLAGTRTAVLVGTASSGYDSLLERAGTPVQGYTAVGAVPSLGPNRVSYLLDLRGPSEPVETACSSSLVALHRAVQLLRSGQCTLALVGGVNVLVSEPLQRSFIEAGMLSEDGRCKTFSERANGYVRGEGAGMLVLKPLSHAQRDGDHIYGLIKGSAESHGGRGNSLTAPNPRAQAELIKEALTEAGVAPDTVTYVEVHSLGTVLGDSIELQGLKSAFQDVAVTELVQGSCALGSIKSNLGHLELAAGVTGIIKILLQMRHRILASTLHAEPINAALGLADGPFHVVTHKQPWRARRDELGRELPLRAGVSSFGLGGVIAHVVLEEYVEPTPPALHDGAPVVVVLSALTRDRLEEQATNLLQRLESVDPRRLGDLAYTLQLGRDAMQCRWSCVVSSLQELRERLGDWLEGRPCAVHEGESRRYNELRAVFDEDSELQEAVQLWVARGKLDKLASAWAKGLSFDWGALHAGRTRRRMSLPSYPFARERHWVQGPNASEAGRPEAANPEPHRADASMYDAPRDEIERTIARLWQELLGVERVGRDQNFFELGGNSLYMETLSARIRSELHVSLSARAIFSAPTVATLAAEVVGALTSMFSHEELAELRGDSRVH